MFGKLYQYASPQRFYFASGKVLPYLFALTLFFILSGLFIGFFVAPIDAQQGEGYRIIFVHVPASWMSMFIYCIMAFWSAIALGFGTRLSSLMAHALAPTGALFTLLSLWTGALWGKPMWGTYWVWDARLTSELILFFLYLGYFALQHAIPDNRRADKACALLALVSVINVPIIYFSVKWWNTLHQGASVNLQGSSMATIMLSAMLLVAVGFWLYTFCVSFMRVRLLILEREQNSLWVKRLLDDAHAPQHG